MPNLVLSYLGESHPSWAVAPWVMRELGAGSQGVWSLLFPEPQLPHQNPEAGG